MSRSQDSSQTSVELVLRQILHGAAGLSTGLTVGCAGSKTVGDTQVSGPVTSDDGDGAASGPSAVDAGAEDAASQTDVTDGSLPTCSSAGLWTVRAEALRPGPRFDYLSVRSQSGVSLDDGSGPETWTQARFTVESERGQKCAGASQPECLQKVQKHPEELVGGSCVQLCTERSVVTTRDERVERWAGPTRLTALLAPIDVADEALLLVSASGYDVPCGEEAKLRQVAGGFELQGARITNACDPVERTGYDLLVSTEGQVQVLAQRVLSSQPGLCIGRVPAGLSSVSHDTQRSVLGDYLARCAHLEAASVVAFERLARELLSHGAPAELVDAALRAATDEVRHARLMAELSAARGGQPVEALVGELPLRSLEEIALENATEGCVRETYGALVGAYQAEHAEDRELAVALREIADDEARHASLSHEIHAWALGELDDAAQARIAAAQREAIVQLAAACAREPDAELLTRAGLPPADLARAFVAELERSLWRSVATLPG